MILASLTSQIKPADQVGKVWGIKQIDNSADMADWLAGIVAELEQVPSPYSETLCRQPQFVIVMVYVVIHHQGLACILSQLKLSLL